MSWDYLFSKKLMICLAVSTIGLLVGINQLAAVQVSASNSQTAESRGCRMTKPTGLKTTTRYGIFGDDAFETVVCGYLVIQPEERFDEKVNVAYLRIVRFYDDGFKQAIAHAIEQGNTVNAKADEAYDFSLGCFKNQTIVTDDQNFKTDLTNEAQTALIDSSVERPVVLLLAFEKHPGSECVCCNLAHQIRLYRP